MSSGKPSRTIFYAWQDDAPRSINRYFVRDAVKQALKKVKRALAVEDALRLDHDTKNVSGTPAIAETIMKKIDACDVFLGDVTLVGRTRKMKRKLSPNPNVLIELGYALGAVGDHRIITVMNERYGTSSELPFDLRHRRSPLTYRLSRWTSANRRREIQDSLAESLRNAIHSVMQAEHSGYAAGAIDFQFADVDSPNPLGTTVSFDIESITVEDDLPIPSAGVGPHGRGQPFVNRDYYRQLVQFIVATRHLRAVRFSLHNQGKRLLQNVKIDIAAKLVDGITLLDKAEFPKEPSYDKIGSLMLPDVGRRDITVSRSQSDARISVTIGNVQPGASEVTGDCFYFGTRQNTRFDMTATVYGDTIERPIGIPLAIEATVQGRVMTSEELQRLLKLSKQQ